MANGTEFRDTHISLAHGNGGRMMRELIEQVFVTALANPHLDTNADAVALPIPADRELMVTTDGFTVQPLEFPGGNIGSLAVHGTVNDLAVTGAVPQFMTLNAFLEEGLEIVLLRVNVALWWSPATRKSWPAGTATGSIWPPPGLAFVRTEYT
jgi:hydrogenase expression/formation protein HypE